MRLVAGLAVATLLVTGVVRAQERIVGGTVVDSVTGRPLSLADVYFTTLPGQGRTDDNGRFRLQGHSPRDSVVVIRRIGYVPRTVAVTPHAPVLATIDIGAVYLRPVATELDKIAVEAEEVRRYPQLDGFYVRKKNLSGLGSFYTREFVERSAAPRTSDLLRQSHKVEIECSKVPGAQCVAASRRARETRALVRARDTAVAEDERFSMGSGRCRMEVWVDGVRSPFDLDQIPVDWIVGIEIYSGPATTPPVFGMGPCGVVAIWTAVPGA
ncbi:MAG: carboxypeptidase regulatory-like domain-containing protein [Gemmatimonadetes bacterium]|nr:carboxypeptidase regulatory-like domain-containing protein [Gemmatimonadota bacterium]